MESIARLVAPPPRNLTLAIIDSSTMPILLLDGELEVIAASASFCGAFGIAPATIAGRKLSDLGDGEWDIPSVNALLVASASGIAFVEGYEFTLRRPDGGPRNLVLNAHKLDYDDDDVVRLLLSFDDVTEVRASDKARDDLVREKSVLLQELQHRVANSLQIVASVLMQSARKVQSEEARGHLADAHTRVMSIAALQRQLTASRLGDVHLGIYFTALCETIGASMINDPTRISLTVHVDGSVTSADTSISLGLIVTELVINALKHAFPEPRQSGAIVVNYQSNGAAWALSVRDDGVGMPPASAHVPAGLGTSIVAALSNQLRASVRKESLDPGTIVWIVGDRAVGTA